MSDEIMVEETGEIAVIGMACRFAGAENLEAFWENLRNGVESIRYFNDEELAHLPKEILENPNYVKAFGSLDDIDHFDATVFGLSPREAQTMDPQLRFFLEYGWHALEHAGYNPETQGHNLAVYGGVSTSMYAQGMMSDPEMAASIGGMQLSIGNKKDHVAPRLSYQLNLRGASVPVQTACSTSLVAVHMACQSLIHHESDMAVAGGCSITSYRKEGYWYQEGGVYSKDGHCRAFDAEAAGTAPGNGVGMVVLKRLEEAIEDGDTIYAVIKASAINNDGSAKVGYTAPSVEGQADVIEEALAVADLDPTDISYIETHGTGTLLGDPIEIEALNQAYGNEPDTIAIGSVKTNIGHCDAAAGVAGLIKTILCIKNKTLVPSLNFTKPNPKIDFASGPLKVNTETRPWEGERRYAGVSSFGIGGTNAHVIVTDAPETEKGEGQLPVTPLKLSAQSKEALAQLRANLANYLEAHPELEVDDAAYTMNVGRKNLPCRAALVFKDRAELIESLRQENFAHVDARGTRGLVFMFPGQGADYVDFGRALYRDNELYRDTVDKLCEELEAELKVNLADLMFAPSDSPEYERLKQPTYWQPAIFVCEFALANLLLELGIEPEAMIGHSIGEYVAATIAGVFSLSDALTLIARRGKGTENLEKGSMLAVPAEEADLAEYIAEPVSLAAVNGPGLCVLSGPTEAINKVETQLEDKGFRPIRLNATHAFHSAMMEPLMGPMTELIGSFELNPPSIPIISNVTGEWLSDEDAVDPAYWGRHLRQAVRFNDGIETLRQESDRVLLEVGPGKVLTNLAKRRTGAPVQAFQTIADKIEEEPRELYKALGEIWCHGIEVNWETIHEDTARSRVPLPLYPFERQGYWYTMSDTAPMMPKAAPSTDEKLPINSWLNTPRWEQTPLTHPTRLETRLAEPKSWIVFADETGFADQVIERLKGFGQKVVRVTAGVQFEQADEHNLTLDPSDPEGYHSLCRLFEEAPNFVLHAWSMTTGERDTDTTVNLGFSSLIRLVQAMDLAEWSASIQLCTLGTGMQHIMGEPLFDPIRGAALGAMAVIPKEFPNLECRSIDLTGVGGGNQAKLVDAVITELLVADDAREIAYRGGTRWVRGFTRVSWSEDAPAKPFREGGVYLIVNALQEMGLSLAAHLTQNYNAKVIVADPSFLPPESEWDEWLADQGEQDLISHRILKIRAVPDYQTRLKLLTVDPANLEQLKNMKQQIEAEFGPIDGVVYLNKPAELGFIQAKNAIDPTTVLMPKLVAAQNMAAVFSGSGFLVMAAEASGEYGVGQVEQGAAYAVLDRLALQLSESHGAQVQSIAWGTRGWAEELENNAAQSLFQKQLQEKRDAFGMSQEECHLSLERILELGLSNVIVSAQDYQAVLDSQKQFLPTALGKDGEAAETSRYPRPNLPNPYEEPRNEVESLVAETWAMFFGLDKVGIHDNFFELGGHSLLAVHLLTKLSQTFALKLNLQHLFDHPTVASISDVINEEQLDEGEADEMEALLAKIEGLSAEEIQAALGDGAA